MEDYSYSSNSVPLKNASVLFASAHGSVENTVFNNIRSILKSFNKIISNEDLGLYIFPDSGKYPPTCMYHFS